MDINEEQGKTLDNIHFRLDTVLGFQVQTTKSYWKLICTIKHPSIAKREKDVKTSIATPDEIRVSRQDESVYLFYRKLKAKYVCVVIKYEAGKSGFVITAYFTNKIKEGKLKWKKVRIYYDTKGNTLNVWFDDPKKRV